MRKVTLLSAVGIALAVLLSIGVPKADANVGISIGIPFPGIAVYAPAPPVYYAPRVYYPGYYAPSYYGYGYGYGYPAYGSVYFGRSWGHRHYGGYGHRYRHYRRY